MAYAAVITADIVNSTSLLKAQEKKLFSQLEEVLKPYRSEFYRGDSFQVYLKDPAAALKLIIELRMLTRQVGADFDIRAAIGIGEVSLPLKKLSTASGEAFLISGRAMDELGKTGDRRLLMRSPLESLNQSLELTAMFVDYIFREMTSKQARVLLIMLAGGTQLAAAKKIRKSQSTIHKHVQSSGWAELSKLLAIYQQLFK